VDAEFVEAMQEGLSRARRRFHLVCGPFLTEIYLCHACSCHEILSGNAAAGLSDTSRLRCQDVLQSLLGSLLEEPYASLRLRVPSRRWSQPVLTGIHLCRPCPRQENEIKGGATRRTGWRPGASTWSVVAGGWRR
jgi:hypothetical protein